MSSDDPDRHDISKTSESEWRAKERVKEIVAFSETSLTVVVFLGGVTFAAMILVMQEKKAFEYKSLEWLLYFPDLLIIGLAVISSLFIAAAAILQLRSVIILRRLNKPLDILTSDLQAAIQISALYGICVFIPLLVLPFNWIGAMIVASVEGLVLVLFFAIVFIDRLAVSYSNSTLSSPQSSSTSPNSFDEINTYKLEEPETYHNNKDDIDD